MKKSMQAVILGLLVVIYYLLDSTLDFILQKELSFFEIMITAIPHGEIFNRLVGILLIALAFFIYIRKVRSPGEAPKRAPEDESQAFLISFSVVEMVNAQMKTTMNTVLGFLNLVKDKNINQNTKTIFTEYVYSSSMALLQLMNNLVGLYQISNDKATKSVSKVNVNQILYSLDKKYNIELNHRIKSTIKLDLHIPQPENEIILSTDSNKLITILEALIENAIGFSKEGTINYGYTIDVKNEIKFFFYDNGSGISMEQLTKAFSAYTRNSGGMDISIDQAAIRTEVANRYAKFLGGKLWSKSQMGGGSSFYLSLPLDKQQSSVEKYKRAEPELHDWSKKKVLIAEDIESNFILLQALLEITGIQIIRAKNGSEAVNLFESNTRNIDLILMDIVMPEMDGFEAAAVIKKKKKTVPIIGQTAYSLDSEQEIEKLKSFDDFLTKPIWDHELMRTMKKYIS